ncbi:MAG: LPS export ABC transporter periplasmic protein LptC [Methylobacter sp.]|jgi:lipopolysaccharide export system protein LptC|nr:LPS export ABC transporter periplasmic protein LptC [Methylobacter sp.]
MIRLNGSYNYLYLIVIAVMSWWLVKLTGSDEFSPIAVPAHSPDYFSKGYTKWEMSELGRPKSKLIADEMIHYSDDGTTHLVKPIMSFYNDKTPPWIIESETGILSADGKDLLLNGKVVVDRAAAEGVRELKIYSFNLKVKPETSYAETDEWAELISLPNWTTGIGMKLTFAEPIHVELLSNVKGNYETK